MNGGTGLAYRDQQAAERIANENRAAHLELIDKLETLNESLDSLALHRLIEEERKAL